MEGNLGNLFGYNYYLLQICWWHKNYTHSSFSLSQNVIFLGVASHLIQDSRCRICDGDTIKVDIFTWLNVLIIFYEGNSFLLSVHNCVFIHVEFNLLEFPPFVTLSFVLAGEWSLCLYWLKTSHPQSDAAMIGDSLWSAQMTSLFPISILNWHIQIKWP